MSGEAPAAAGGGAAVAEANGNPPNVTIYINNLNEKIKLEGPPSSPSVAKP
jgi:U1 small nuclear ribonucleoprotein A